MRRPRTGIRRAAPLLAFPSTGNTRLPLRDRLMTRLCRPAILNRSSMILHRRGDEGDRTNHMILHWRHSDPELFTDLTIGQLFVAAPHNDPTRLPWQLIASLL